VVDGLLDYVQEREDDFRPATVYSRVMPLRVDPHMRDCLQLRDLGPFKAPFAAAVAARAAPAAQALGVDERNLYPAEFEICTYGDGGAFRIHTDNRSQTGGGDIRVLTCVYYFSETPRRFGGGALLIHPWPVRVPGLSDQPIEIEPACNSLVMFPSMLPHEVASVQLQEGSWRARRLTLTCWLWRLPGRT
jgi:Rps23 Pro-64 3,4-dihydroxylase Tpa1-like proline 4-hydroxylase